MVKVRIIDRLIIAYNLVGKKVGEKVGTKVGKKVGEKLVFIAYTSFCI